MTPSATASTPDAHAAQMPATWYVTHLGAQMGVLMIAGLAMLALTWRSPVLEALLAQLADIADPWAPVLPVRIIVPLLFPIALGIPLALARYRAPLLLWVAVMASAALLGVIEVARLNWAAFVTGVAFRVETGPVPLARSAAGLVLILCGVLLMGQQSVQHQVGVLAERGVARSELAALRRHLLQRERSVTALAGVAGIVLLLIARFSMGLTERAPGEDAAILPALIWVGLLLAALAGVFAVMGRRRSAAR